MIVGVSSFAYRYHARRGGLDPRAFFALAWEDGFHAAQLCENIAYEALSSQVLESAAREARKVGLALELGMRDLSDERLFSALERASCVGAGLLRVVLGKPDIWPERSPQKMTARCACILRNNLEEIHRSGILVGVENHFDVRTRDIADLLDRVGDPQVGAVFDSTNALGFLERNEETLTLLQGHILSAHIKDYRIRKCEGGYFITGVPLGEGDFALKPVLRRLMSENPLHSLMIELTIKPEDVMDTPAILDWERQAIRSSRLCLENVIKEIAI